MEQIFLTRRNLKALLSKLDRHASGDQTFCTIVKFDMTHLKYPCTVQTAITAVEDADYYTDREAGAVFPEDDQS